MANECTCNPTLTESSTISNNAVFVEGSPNYLGQKVYIVRSGGAFCLANIHSTLSADVRRQLVELRSRE